MATTIELKITGMSCEHCVRAVTEALEGVSGVSAVKVDLASGRASVQVDTDTVALPALIEAVEEQGFEAEAG